MCEIDEIKIEWDYFKQKCIGFESWLKEEMERKEFSKFKNIPMRMNHYS